MPASDKLGLPKRRGRRPKGQRLLCYLGSERVTHTSTLRVDAVPTGGAVTHNSTKWMLVGPVWQVSVTSAGSTIGNDGVVGDYARRERPIRVTREISAPAEVVWAVIATPGHLEHVHPFCEHNPVTEWPGAASRDEIHYRSGWVYERTFTHWVDGVGYDLDIGAPGEPTSHVSWRISPRPPGACNLAISVWPRSLTRIRGLQYLLRLLVLGPMMRHYLRSVTKGVEWFVTQGEPVRANQFGTHQWFSQR